MCFVYMQDERTPATRRAVLSRCVPFLLFRDISLSIFYQTTYLDIRLSIVGLTVLYRCVLLG